MRKFIQGALSLAILIIYTHLAVDWGIYLAKLDCDDTGNFHWAEQMYSCVPVQTRPAPGEEK